MGNDQCQCIYKKVQEEKNLNMKLGEEPDNNQFVNEYMLKSEQVLLL